MERPFSAFSTSKRSYEDVILALRGVSLAVEEGAIVALLGAKRRREDHNAQGDLQPDRGRARPRQPRLHPVARRGDRDMPIPRTSCGKASSRCSRAGTAFPSSRSRKIFSPAGFLRRPSRSKLRRRLERIYRWFPRLKERRKTRSGLPPAASSRWWPSGGR